MFSNYTKFALQRPLVGEMRLLGFWAFGVIFVSIVSRCAASSWSPEDYEIFKLNDKIQEDLGPGFDFYRWLELDKGPRSNGQEIAQAYRRKSRQLHPDKVSGVSRGLKKQAEERFQRLSLVGNILRDQSLKKRYDYFLDKGFPQWRGSGYFYSKFRPGLVLTLMVVFALVSVLHYVALRINRNQTFKRIVAMKEMIKLQAWGGSVVPPTGGGDRFVRNEESGKQFVVKADGEVYLQEIGDDNKETLVLVDEFDINVRPGFKETLLFKVPSFAWNLTLGRVIAPINTEVVHENPNKKVVASGPSKDKTKKKARRGEKFELPNGKVLYGRESGSSSRKRKGK